MGRGLRGMARHTVIREVLEGTHVVHQGGHEEIPADLTCDRPLVIFPSGTTEDEALSFLWHATNYLRFASEHGFQALFDDEEVPGQERSA